MSEEHEAILSPDARGRFPLRKFLGSDPDARYRVYVDREAGRVTLERI